MKMRNDRSLSQQEIDTIVAWVKAGAPRGEPTDMPAVPKFASGWQLGQPDYIFEMPVEWTMKAEGAEPYLYFYQQIPFTEDKLAQAIEIRPSNFATVHHSGAYVMDIPDGYTVKDGYLYDKKGKQIPPTEPMGKKASSGDDAPLAGADKLISYVPGRGIEPIPRATPSAFRPGSTSAGSCTTTRPEKRRRIAAASGSGSRRAPSVTKC